MDYLIAADQREEAARELRWAVTITQQESAARRLARVEGHKLFAMGELLAHCERKACMLPIPDPALAELLVYRLFASGAINASADRKVAA
jgi:hypothetical protein